ncbi:hypothetical protein, partial [Nocardioides malaquae]|uniref:hypothetical protein n=1 Tax=Nocardioides malaquae TaxID=2773426 RepID=UPI001D0D46BE
DFYLCMMCKMPKSIKYIYDDSLDPRLSSWSYGTMMAQQVKWQQYRTISFEPMHGVKEDVDEE